MLHRSRFYALRNCESVSESAQAVTTRMAQLRRSGAALRTKPASENLETLCRVLDAWCAPASSYQKRLVADLRDTANFSEEVIRAGLSRGLSDWNGEALRAVVNNELGEIDRLDETGTGQISGFELTTTILAGAIPMPTLLSMLLPLVLRSPVLVKTGQRDRKTAQHVLASIEDFDSDLAACISVVDFPRDETDATQALLRAPCIVAMGSDSTIKELSSHVEAWQRWVPYGHRLSLAVLGPDIQNTTKYKQTSKKLAQDVALWDQSGCLSPAAVFVLGNTAEAAKIAESLAGALQDLASEWPRGAVDTQTAAAIHHEREEARLRSAAGQAVRVFASDDTGWTVVSEADSQWRATPLHRFVRVYPVADLEALSAALRPLSNHLSSVALQGFSEQRDVVTRKILELGASRVCMPGALQTPPLGWHHDGRPLLLPLARLHEDESSAS